jgi:hypothetical protein
MYSYSPVKPVAPPSLSSSPFLAQHKIKAPRLRRENFFNVGPEGFEPPKAKPADLQSAPFDRFGTDPVSHLSDSNRRPAVYKTDALPAELRWHVLTVLIYAV